MANELKQYIDETNVLNMIFGDKEYDLNIAVDRRSLAEKLDYDLSPENLTCDGEVRGVALKRKYIFLTRAQAQLDILEQHEMKHDMWRAASVLSENKA